MKFRLSVKDEQYAIDHITTNLMKGRLNNHVAMHKHPVFHLIYILEGRGTVTVGGTMTAAEPGMLYVISPNEPHSFLFGDGEPLTNLESTFRLLDDHGEAAEIQFSDLIDVFREEVLPEADLFQPLSVPARLKPHLREGFNRILELYDTPLLRHHFSFMVADLIARVEIIAHSATEPVEPVEPAMRTISDVKQFLYTNRGRPVTLGEAAEHAHLTPNYLCRIFKEHADETPMGYLQAIRMAEAEKLLAFTDLPVYTIAEKLGYEEPSYFARVFRSVYGESPQAYRKRLVIENRIK
ncbi:helix-turn-helix transcriptional regulator [Paenibacillus athensensis]|uniref:HTH araC/xylS-type domain-containing protein n=1 Tax=Paenibacillus athensensis TaxID=1967502 RepID=A0A4Y8PZU6_9BACL|nr:AraC family transcriptional regulator [Paenibacillus athensensis]MCD1261399.1 helix-turn-helix transcriptional regulator [Paenibacillus athensensis]